MQTSPNLLRVMLHSIRDAVVTTDASARIQLLNRAAEELTGWRSDDAAGLPIEFVLDLHASGADRALLNPAYAVLREGNRIHHSSHPGQTNLIAKSGRRIPVDLTADPVFDSEAKMEGCVLVFHDLTEALQLASRLAYQAQHDPLTGLPNRILLVDRMEQSARLADRNNELMAVMFVDLDLFSEVKASLGQDLADDLLKEAAARLTAALRESDTVCRLGRDEFVILLPGVKSLGQVEAVADKILQEIAKPCLLGEHTIETSCSLGISIYPHDATDTGTLMRLADQAMAYAKKSGRNRYVFASADSARITLIPIVPSYNE